MRNTPISVKRVAVATLATVCALALASPANARPTDNDDSPPSDKITVEVITVNGSGCKPGTAHVEQSDDNTSFKVTYDAYIAQGGAAPTDVRKNCQLALRFKIPQGFSYAISKVEYRGFAALQPGATAEQSAQYYIQGQSSTLKIVHPIKNGRWHTQDTFEEAQLVWSPCGETRNLNVNSALRVFQPAGTPGTSKVTMKATEGEVDTLYHFSWKRC